MGFQVPDAVRGNYDLFSYVNRSWRLTQEDSRETDFDSFDPANQCNPHSRLSFMERDPPGSVRIHWARPVIENESDVSIKVWENRRGGGRRICLWLQSEDYLVILADRKGYVILWTAYMVTQPHQKRKLQAEYEECSKS